MLLRLCLLAVVLGNLLCALASAAEPTLRLRTLTPTPSDAALVNPGMGLYKSGTLNPDDMPDGAWFRDLIAIGYFRTDWADLLGDGPGQYRFEEYFTPIFDLWVNRWHKRVAFRFMASNMHSRRKYVLPQWVFDSGVPSVVHKGLYVPEQVDPVFWEERHLANQERFIAALGRYLDGHPGVEFLDIGDIGEWGEMHLSRWTPEELTRTGYTDDRYVAAYRRIIDAFARAFPRTRVFLNVGDFAAINDYAALRGLHFRQDGLSPSGPSADVGNRFYRPYARRGVQCNYEFHSGYQEMQEKGWGIRETFAKGLEDPISYLNLNLTWYHQLKDPPADLKESILDAAHRIGYRFVLTSLRTNDVVHVDGHAPGRLVLEQTWKNLGVAPCYESYALRWSLLGDGGRTVAETISYPRVPTNQWWPGEEISLSALLTLPPDTPPGTYHLAVAMVAPETPGTDLQLGLAGRDASGRYLLGDAPVARVTRHTSVIYQSDFGLSITEWDPAPGLQSGVARDEQVRERVLVLRGTQPGQAWQYATTPISTLLPYSRYRLTGWMKVESISPAHPPYLKLGLNDRDGTWITNVNTNRYDLDKLGTWQKLTVEADTPPEAGSADLCVERGVFEPPITVTLSLRDVKLELLETP